MRWTCLLALALIVGCATKLTPDKQLLKLRNEENRPHLPQPTATRIPPPDGVRSLNAKSAKTVIAPPGNQIFPGTNGCLVERWTAFRWKISAPVGYRLQGAKFNTLSADGSVGTAWEWFTLPYFGTSGNSVTSNVPDVDHMNFRAIPSSAARSFTDSKAPQWFLNADKKTK